MALEELRAAGERCRTGEEMAGSELKELLLSTFQGEMPACGALESMLSYVNDLFDPEGPGGQALLEDVGWDLPLAIAQFINVSEPCKVLVASIMNHLAGFCPPRDVLTSLVEALDAEARNDNLEACIILLRAIRIVLPRIQRRRAECVREAVQAVLSACDWIVNDDILPYALEVCETLHHIYESEKLEQQKELLRRTAVAFVLALLTFFFQSELDEAMTLAYRLSEELTSYGIGFRDLITRELQDYVEVLPDINTLSNVNYGAALAALLQWPTYGEEADTFQELELEEDRLKDTVKGMQLILFKTTCSGNWALAERGLEYIRGWFSATKIKENDTNAYLVLLEQLSTMVVTCPALRGQSHGCLLSILRSLPARMRFESLMFLVEHSHPAVASLLLMFAKDEVHSSWPSSDKYRPSPFTSVEVLKLLELALMHSFGTLPENVDTVLGALNLYRFILVREKSGGTNHTRIRSPQLLETAKEKWLEPLRCALLQLLSSVPKEHAGLLHSAQIVLLRCLEIVNEQDTRFKDK